MLHSRDYHVFILYFMPNSLVFFFCGSGVLLHSDNFLKLPGRAIQDCVYVCLAACLRNE